MSNDKCAETCTTSAPITPIQEPPPNGVPRVHMPDRSQLDPRPRELESLLPEWHTARIVWGYVIGLNLSDLYAQIKAFEGSECLCRLNIDPPCRLNIDPGLVANFRIGNCG